MPGLPVGLATALDGALAVGRGAALDVARGGMVVGLAALVDSAVIGVVGAVGSALLAGATVDDVVEATGGVATVPDEIGAVDVVGLGSLRRIDCTARTPSAIIAAPATPHASRDERTFVRGAVLLTDAVLVLLSPEPESASLAGGLPSNRGASRTVVAASAVRTGAGIVTSEPTESFERGGSYGRGPVPTSIADARTPSASASATASSFALANRADGSCAQARENHASTPHGSEALSCVSFGARP